MAFVSALSWLWQSYYSSSCHGSDWQRTVHFTYWSAWHLLFSSSHLFLLLLLSSLSSSSSSSNIIIITTTIYYLLLLWLLTDGEISLHKLSTISPCVNQSPCLVMWHTLPQLASTSFFLVHLCTYSAALRQCCSHREFKDSTLLIFYLVNYFVWTWYRYGYEISLLIQRLKTFCVVEFYCCFELFVLSCFILVDLVALFIWWLLREPVPMVHAEPMACLITSSLS